MTRQLTSDATTDRFAVRKGRTKHLDRAADIRWIEAQGYYAALHTDSGSFLLRRSLTRLEDELDPGKFIRVHRSTIVNIDHVDGMTTNDSGSCLVMLADGKRRGVSRGGRRKLRSVLRTAS
ncbi:MAG: LytTR family DNA-binding domain-containing protein [Woeseiaceae bacterium]